CRLRAGRRHRRPCDLGVRPPLSHPSLGDRLDGPDDLGHSSIPPTPERPMNRFPRPWHARRLWLSPALVLVFGLVSVALGGAERLQPPIEVYEWSVWIGSPAQSSLNAPAVYRNAMPGTVGTVRPKFEGEELARKFAVAPISVVQAFGDPAQDIDIDLRVK